MLSATQALQPSFYQHRPVVLARMKMSICIRRKLSSRKFPACLSHSSPTFIKNRSSPVPCWSKGRASPTRTMPPSPLQLSKVWAAPSHSDCVLPVTPAAVAAPQRQCSAVLEEILVGGRGKKPKASISHCFFFQSFCMCNIAKIERNSNKS